MSINTTFLSLLLLLTILLGFGVLLVGADTVFAQATSSVTVGKGGLVPCDGPPLPSNVEAPADYTPCSYNAFILLVQKIIDWVIKTMGIVAAILFTYAGFLYLTAGGDENKVRKAHGIFKAVIVGVIIVLGAWLIVNTIVSEVVDEEYLRGILESS